MSISTPLISVVIVSWNVKDFLLNCVGSILNSTIKDQLEIIIVDNASSDDTVAALRIAYGHYNNVVIHASNENLGFANGNNLGFSLATGAYTFILNPDTLVLPNTIEQLYNTIIKDESIGMVGPKLIFDNGIVQWTSARKLPGLMDTLLFECLKVARWSKKISLFLAKRIRAPYSYSSNQVVEAISGAAMLIKTSDLIKIGMFGAEYLHCGEDIELCWKVSKIGKKIMYCEPATVIHFENQSSKKAALRTQINALLSIGIYIRKTKGNLAFFLYRLLIICLKIPIEFVTYCILLIRNNFRSSNDIDERRQLILRLIDWRPIVNDFIQAKKGRI